MSQFNHLFKGRALPLAMLIGALGFSLSSLPGLSSTLTNGQSADFSSVSGRLRMCDLTALGRGGEAECRIVNPSNSHVTTRMVIRLVKSDSNSDNNLLGSNKPKAQDGSGSLNYEVTTETECDVCDFRTEPNTTPIHESRMSTYGDLKMDLRHILASAQRDFDKKMRKKKQKDAEIKSCKRDEDGTVLKGNAILDCKLDRYSNMDDGSKKDAYFESDLKGKIKELIDSGKPEDRVEAAKLMRKIGMDASVKTRAALLDLSHYDQYRRQVTALAFQVKTLDRFAKFNPRYAQQRQNALNQLHTLESTQGLHYAQEGYITAPISNSVLSTGSLPNASGSAGAAYEAQLNSMYSQYDAVVNSHKQMINRTLSFGQRGSGARFMRGGLASGVQPASPTVAGPVIRAAGTATQPQSVTTVTSPLTIPQVGQHVNWQRQLPHR